MDFNVACTFSMYPLLEEYIVSWATTSAFVTLVTFLAEIFGRFKGLLTGDYYLIDEARFICFFELLFFIGVP